MNFPRHLNAGGEGPTFEIEMTQSGGAWSLVKTARAWRLQPVEAGVVPAAEVALLPEVAWRLFTKGLSPTQARPLTQVVGDETLAEATLRLVAVMA